VLVRVTRILPTCGRWHILGETCPRRHIRSSICLSSGCVPRQPREATIIKTKVGPKFDHQVLATLGLPAKTVACFAPAAVASGYQGAPQIETSLTATVHFEDSSPADIVGPGGAVATPTFSAFQTHLISIRVRARAAWAVAPDGAQVINDVNW
jgi:hypothetical protein